MLEVFDIPLLLIHSVWTKDFDVFSYLIEELTRLEFVAAKKILLRVASDVTGEDKIWFDNAVAQIQKGQP